MGLKPAFTVCIGGLDGLLTHGTLSSARWLLTLLWDFLVGFVVWAGGGLEENDGVGVLGEPVGFHYPPAFPVCSFLVGFRPVPVSHCEDDSPSLEPFGYEVVGPAGDGDGQWLPFLGGL